MLASIDRPLKFVFQRLAGALESTVFGRRLLYDIKNSGGFGNLYEHEKMIADTVRVENYYKAIQRHIKPEDVVVDLGTGTGILAFFAAQQNPKKIYAIDHSEFINVAEQIAQHNNIKNITFVKTHSRDFNPDEKLDVILHEQIGDVLFNENMLENIFDLKKRLLAPGGKILPGKFELFLEPVCLKPDQQAPYLWEDKVYGIDFRFLKNNAAINQYMPRRYARRYLEHGAVDYFLCEPEAVLSFDINTMNDENDLPRRITASKKIARRGPLNGICLYFRVIFDEEISFDTSPLHTRTSWTNVLFRTECREYEPGDEISFNLDMEILIRPSTWSLTLQ